MRRIFTSIALLLVILAGIGAAVFLELNKLLILSFLCFSGVFCIAATWFIYKTFLDGIRKSTAFASTISRGDLSGRLSLPSEDEVGQLSEALNRMAVNLRFMLAQIKSSVAELSGLIDRNYTTFELVMRATNSQTRNFNGMFVSLKALGDDIRLASGNADGVLDLAEKAAVHAAEGKNALNKLLAEAEAIKTSSGQVYSIVSIMNEISEKTRLLALNASLNSPDAAGSEKTAPEIRKLAERIGDSTRSIGKTVRVNLEISNRTVSAVNEVNRSFHRIRNDVEDIARLTRAVQSATTGELRESEHLTLLKNRVEEIAEENIRHINELVDYTGSLSRKTGGLEELLAKFRTGED